VHFVREEVKIHSISSLNLLPVRYVEGTGKVEVKDPAIECAYCKGTGVYPHGSRITCTVCNGKGMVTVKGTTERCPKCRGTGQAIGSGLSCIKCGGKGVVRKKEEA
jgi:DnaJ-class molecular chaperone